MNVSSPERIRGRLKEGWDLLRAGHSRDAGLAFGRILLTDPRHPEARRGLAQATAAAEEARRDREARLDEARRALEAGDASLSRRLLEPLASAGEAREPALALLDRLDGREGRIGPLPAPGGPRGDAPAACAPAPPVWLRRWLLAFWSVAIVSLSAGLAGSWDRIVEGLLEAPEPASRNSPPATELAAPKPGERALELASRLLAQGDPAGAVQALNGVPPDDPAYPFSLRLRLEAQASLANRERRR